MRRAQYVQPYQGSRVKKLLSLTLATGFFVSSVCGHGVYLWAGPYGPNSFRQPDLQRQEDFQYQQDFKSNLQEDQYKRNIQQQTQDTQRFYQQSVTQSNLRIFSQNNINLQAIALTPRSNEINSSYGHSLLNVNKIPKPFSSGRKFYSLESSLGLAEG